MGLLREMGEYLEKFYVTVNQAVVKKQSLESNLSQYYFNINVEPIYKSVSEKTDGLFEIIGCMPSSEFTKNTLSAVANYRAGITRSGMSLRGFIECGSDKYVNEYKDVMDLHDKGRSALQGTLKDVSDVAWEVIVGLIEEDEQFVNHAKMVFELGEENNIPLDLKHLREELVPLVTSIQDRIDKLGVNMSKSLEDDANITLGLQRSIWLIASIAIGVGVVAGIFLIIFNMKYMVLY